jgi:hypothetical protein
VILLLEPVKAGSKQNSIFHLLSKLESKFQLIYFSGFLAFAVLLSISFTLALLISWLLFRTWLIFYEIVAQSTMEIVLAMESNTASCNT